MPRSPRLAHKGRYTLGDKLQQRVAERDHSMCTGPATSCSNKLRRHVAATTRFMCAGEFWWKSLSLQQSFVAATSSTRLQNSPNFCVFKNARAVKQKVWNEAENRERDWGETLKIRFFFLSPHTPFGRVRLARFARVRLLRHPLPISLLILRKKPTVLQSKVAQILSDLIFCDLLQRQNYVAEIKIFTKILQHTRSDLSLRRVAATCCCNLSPSVYRP